MNISILLHLKNLSTKFKTANIVKPNSVLEILLNHNEHRKTAKPNSTHDKLLKKVQNWKPAKTNSALGILLNQIEHLKYC